MIILNSKKIKLNLKENENNLMKTEKYNISMNDIINNYEENISNCYLECPACKSDKIISWGKYKRTIKYLCNGYIINKKICIHRVKCKHCNKTHALLFNQIIPYKQSVLEVILHSVFDTDISNRFDISFDTIEKWKKSFKHFKPYFATTYNNITSIVLFLKHIFLIYYTYYIINKEILMMTHTGIFNMAYF